MTPETEPDLKLEIAHILTIDVVAYSTLLINEQTQLMTTLVQAVRATPRFRQAEASGQFIRLPTGDGMALVFLRTRRRRSSARCRFARNSKSHPEIPLRMGIHSGPVKTIRDVNDRTNLAGAGIDVAQRVMDCGDAGHILLSKRVADDLAPHPRWNRYLHDLGECEVKHGRKVSLFNFYSDSCGNPQIPQKVECRPTGNISKLRRKAVFLGAAMLLICAAVFFFLTRNPPSKPAIAVLPFVDLSQNKDQEYLGDGIAEQIINSLRKIHGLSVVARTSSFALKNKFEDVRAIGHMLNATHVLEGSVSRASGRVRVDAHLISVANGYQLWGETYDSSESDALSLQTNMAEKVASALEVELQLKEKAAIAKVPTQDTEASDLYLRGRYLLNKRTVDSLQKALALFQEAVAKDKKFALGRVGIADAYILLAKNGVMPGEEAARLAWPEVSSALSLDPQLAEVYVARGILRTDFEWNWSAAEADFEKALLLDPSSASAHHWYARHLAQIGRLDEAQREIRTAEKLDPLSPMILVSEGKIYFLAHKYESAIAPCRAALELEPNYATAFSILAQAYAHQGKRDLAIDAAKKYVALSNGSGWARLELAYAEAVTGNRSESERIVREVTSGTKEFSPNDMAAIYSAWRDSDGALRWLEKAIQDRSVDVITVRVDPRLDNVRSDPRFQEVPERWSRDNCSPTPF